MPELCRHCPNSRPHKFVCDCGHHHNQHVFGAGCIKRNCSCDRYSQVKQRKPNDKSTRSDNTVSISEARV
jgi:hypothetical protein